MTKDLTQILPIRYPVIMAPMFLVSNEKMLIEASKAGITGAIPALNYRTVEQLEKGLRLLKETEGCVFGVNLIVNKSNFLLKKQLDVCCKVGVDYIITSLGSPENVIKQAHAHNIKVFCDVVDLEFAFKVEALGADALIAVSSEAGGHAGNVPGDELVAMLVKNCTIPVISAGGIGTGQGIRNKMNLGAAGVSMGSIFIASKESGVTQEYKQACVDYGAKDIVMSEKLSGTKCSVINTPYLKKIGTKQHFWERFLNKNKRLKKWVKSFVFYKGMKSLEQAAFKATYKTVWVAGPSIEYVKEIRSVKDIVNQLVSEYEMVE